MNDAARASFYESSFCLTTGAITTAAAVQPWTPPSRVATGGFEVVRHIFAVRTQERLVVGKEQMWGYR